MAGDPPVARDPFWPKGAKKGAPLAVRSEHRAASWVDRGLWGDTRVPCFGDGKVVLASEVAGCYPFLR